MKKEHKLLALLFLGALALCIIIPAAHAADITDVKSFLTEWIKFFTISEGQQGEVARWLLIAIVAMLVYSVIDFFSQNEWIKVGISVAVAFLSFMFVTAETIKGILTTYEALGVVLSSVIPFVVIALFSAKLSQHNSVGAKIVSKGIIIGFGLYMIIALFKYGFNKPLSWIYILTTIGAIVWFFTEKYFVGKWEKEESKAQERASLDQRIQEIEGQLEVRMREHPANLPPAQERDWNTKNTKLEAEKEGLIRRKAALG